MGRDIRPVYLGNFEYDATSREIERLCERYGDLDHVDMKTGFAFVYYKDSRDADDAIRAMDGKEFGYKRRRLRCEYSKGDGEIKRREDKRREVVKPTTTIFVVNFNVEDTRERDLERLYERYGRLVRVQIKRTYAFIQFEKVEQAEAALKDTHLSRFMGRTISVEFVCKEPGDALRSGGGGGGGYGGGGGGYGGGGGGGGYDERDRGRDRYRSRSRSVERRPRSRSPSYGKASPRGRSLSPRGRSASRGRSMSRSPRGRSRSPAGKASASRSPRRSPSRSRSP